MRLESWGILRGEILVQVVCRLESWSVEKLRNSGSGRKMRFGGILGNPGESWILQEYIEGVKES